MNADHIFSDKNVGQELRFLAMYIIFRHSKAFLAGTPSNLREVVEIDEFAFFFLLPVPKFHK